MYLEEEPYFLSCSLQLICTAGHVCGESPGGRAERQPHSSSALEWTLIGRF